MIVGFVVLEKVYYLREILVNSIVKRNDTVYLYSLRELLERNIDEFRTSSLDPTIWVARRLRIIRKKMQYIKQTETTMTYLLEDERPSYDFEDL